MHGNENVLRGLKMSWTTMIIINSQKIDLTI